MYKEVIKNKEPLLVVIFSCVHVTVCYLNGTVPYHLTLFAATWSVSDRKAYSYVLFHVTLVNCHNQLSVDVRCYPVLCVCGGP